MSVTGIGGLGSLPPATFKNVELAINGMCSVCEAELCWQNYIVMAK